MRQRELVVDVEEAGRRARSAARSGPVFTPVGNGRKPRPLMCFCSQRRFALASADLDAVGRVLPVLVADARDRRAQRGRQVAAVDLDPEVGDVARMREPCSLRSPRRCRDRGRAGAGSSSSRPTGRRAGRRCRCAARSAARAPGCWYTAAGDAAQRLSLADDVRSSSSPPSRAWSPSPRARRCVNSLNVTCRRARTGMPSGRNMMKRCVALASTQRERERAPGEEQHRRRVRSRGRCRAGR